MPDKKPLKKIGTDPLANPVLYGCYKKSETSSEVHVHNVGDINGDGYEDFVLEHRWTDIYKTVGVCSSWPERKVRSYHWYYFGNQKTATEQLRSAFKSRDEMVKALTPDSKDVVYTVVGKTFREGQQIIYNGQKYKIDYIENQLQKTDKTLSVSIGVWISPVPFQSEKDKVVVVSLAELGREAQVIKEKSP